MSDPHTVRCVCPACGGDGVTVEMEMRDRWVPAMDMDTGDMDESGAGGWGQKAHPVQAQCPVCSGEGAIDAQTVEEATDDGRHG